MAGRERKPRTMRVAVSTGSTKKVDLRLVPWHVATIGGALLVAVAGWFLIAGAVAIGWLAAPDAGFVSALRLGTRLWVLANGGAATVGEVTVSIVPLGLSLLIVLLATGAVSFACQQASRDERLSTQQGWRITGLFTAVYVAAVVGTALLVGQSALLWRAALGAAVIAGASSALMTLRASGHELLASWPMWAKSVPKAAGAALLIVLIGAGIALTTGLLLAKDRVVELHDALAPGVAGGILLLLLQLAYLPNFLAWCASWTLGAGFAIGTETVVAPSDNQLGLLPSLPVFAAVPPAGPGTWPMLWWLLVGVVAGAVAALIVVRARPQARYDETALVGGLAGVAAGLLVLCCCALSNGSIGIERMTELGARLGVLAVLAPTLLGVSGLVAGLVLGLAWRRGTRTAPQDAETEVIEAKTEVLATDASAEETTPVG